LAHILSDGSVASWSPSQDGHAVLSLALTASTLYVGGTFSVIDGQPRQGLAAFDVDSGGLLPWDPHPDGSVVLGPVVRALAARGDTVFVAGDFRLIGAQPRICLAALDGRTGRALDWYPGASNSEILALKLRGNALFLGGYFTQIGGLTRNRAAAVDASTGVVLPWNPDVSGPDDVYVGSARVWALGVRDSTVYLGGQFLGVGDQSRNALAAVDADSGRVLPWNPSPAHTYTYPYPYVRSLFVQGDTIYVGGNFESIGGADRISLAAIDAATGQALDWNPRPDSDHDVIALAVSGGVVYAGGTFPTLGPWKARSCLAALDLTTGAVKDWNPDANGLFVDAMVVSGGTVYVGGDFTFIGGLPRNGVAALDTLTGAATPWNPSADGQVRAMSRSGNTLYVGGGFSNIGGQSRAYAAALDMASGLATAWDPRASDWVLALATEGESVYLGGLFQSMGGEPRLSVAAVDTASGTVKPWRADTDGIIDALVVDGSTVFVGGEYVSTVGGQPRTCLAALDAVTGDVRAWDAHLTGSVANPTPSVHALALSAHTLYVGGDFYTVGGQVRPCLAALDDSVGLATSWAPGANFQTLSLAIAGNTLYAGGAFGAVGLQPSQGLVGLSIPNDPVILRQPSFTLAQNFPNPARGETTLRFSLPAAFVASLAVYDIQGRRIATPLRPSLLQPGPHAVPLRLDGMSPGVYLYRLEAGGRAATRKMLVLR
jgi:hypothetical protein